MSGRAGGTGGLARGLIFVGPAAVARAGAEGEGGRRRTLHSHRAGVRAVHAFSKFATVCAIPCFCFFECPFFGFFPPRSRATLSSSSSWVTAGLRGIIIFGLKRAWASERNRVVKISEFWLAHAQGVCKGYGSGGFAGGACGVRITCRV